jgi:hypothetical protein
MPTLVIDNAPLALFDRIQRLAKAKQRTAADTALEALESAFRSTTPTFAEAPLPQEPFLTEEICAPCSIRGRKARQSAPCTWTHLCRLLMIYPGRIRKCSLAQRQMIL